MQERILGSRLSGADTTLAHLIGSDRSHDLNPLASICSRIRYRASTPASTPICHVTCLSLSERERMREQMKEIGFLTLAHLIDR